MQGTVRVEVGFSGNIPLPFLSASGIKGYDFKLAHRAGLEEIIGKNSSLRGWN